MNRSWLQKTSGWPKHNFCLKCWNMLNYFVNFVNLSHTNSVQQLHFWSEFWQTAHVLVFWEAPLHPENVQEWISWCKVSPKKLKLKKLRFDACGFRPLCGWRIRWCLCPSACSRCHCHSDHSAVTLVVRIFIRLLFEADSKHPKVGHAAMPQLSSEFLHGLRLLLFHFCRFPHKSPVVDLENTLKDRTVPKMRIWDINSLIQHETCQFCRAILSSPHKYVAKRGFLHQFLTLSQVSSRCHPNFIGTTATRDLAKRLQFNIQQQRLSSCQAVKPCRHADMQCDMQTCCSGLLWC